MISKLVLVLAPLIATLTHWSTGSAFSMTCTIMNIDISNLINGPEETFLDGT